MALAGLSDAFVYAPKPPAAPASNIRVTVPSYNKDRFSAQNDTMMFNIPSGKRGQYMNPRMSYLRFDLEVTSNFDSSDNIPVLALDGGAHSLIQNLEVYHGSNLLEQIREYNNIHQLMLDTGEIPDGTNTGRSVAEGTVPGGSYTRSEDTYAPMYGSSKGRNGIIVSPVHLPNLTHGAVETNATVKTDVTWLSDKPDGIPGTDTSWDAGSAIGNHYTMDPDSSARGEVDVAAATGIPTFENDMISAAVVPSARALDVHASTVRDSQNRAIVVDDATTRTFTFCIPIVSGIVGAQMPKYIPVGSLAQDLRLELGIANMQQALKTIAAYSTEDNNISTFPGDILAASSDFNKYGFAISNAELQLEYVEVASDVQQAIEASTGGQYVVSFDSFYNFQTTTPQNPGSITQLIGAKFSSIKTVYTTWRDIYGINNPAYPSITSRLNPFGTKPNRPGLHDKGTMWNPSRYNAGTGWQYMIGSTHYPSKPVQSDQEAFFEAVKAQHSVATQSRTGLIDGQSWAVSARRDSNGGTDSTPSRWYHYAYPGGTYFTAQNLESQSHKSHLAESGVNTLAQSMYLTARFPGEDNNIGGGGYNVQVAPNVGSRFDGGISTVDATTNIPTAMFTRRPWVQTNQGMQLDTIIHYDGILIISNGVCTTRF